MSLKSSDQIRQEFFDFFREKEHVIVNSAPVVPEGDPTLLFTNAGMNQFKPIFLGEESGFHADGQLWQRAADTQRCIRVSGKHNDLEEVGHDTYHHTLFEMLGNWSFGDYFKKEAIGWAWELLTQTWGLESGRLYATVFEGDKADGLPFDEESANLWKTETTIPHDHILGFSRKDNFWEMGDTGPCGPCSEIHIDLRPDSEREKTSGADLVNMDDPRVMEIWNLVFIQFDRKNDGKLVKLPAQHVDTGMGFERLCAALQGKSSNYDTDVFEPLLTGISNMCGISYGSSPESDIAMRVIADHVRAVSFAVADGASPSNDGRGYVIRRILRRAVRYGWDRLDLKKPFLYKLVPVLATQFKTVFPELSARVDYVENVVKAEEQAFLETLGQGIGLFAKMTSSGSKLSGDDAFKLHDTYGFPIDLTQLMAREKGISVDTDRFEELMNQQRQRARSSGKFHAGDRDERNWQILIKSNEFEFVGYDHLSADVQIKAVTSSGDTPWVRLDRSPFYAESGGQVADTGTLKQGDDELRVLDVQKDSNGFLHLLDRAPGEPTGSWVAEVDPRRRLEIQRHHTATHLLHASLRELLGSHVAQKGSLVAHDRLRFDFSHFEGLSGQQIDEIEALVNDKIRMNIPRLEERGVSIDAARDRGAMMLFGEKYGEHVRVITFDESFSVELCGGTHAGSTGELGYFRILSESSNATGIRRAEAVVGNHADLLLRKEKRTLGELQQLLGQSENLAADIQSLLDERKSLEKELKKIEQKQASGKLDQLLQQGKKVGDILLITGQIAGADVNILKQMGYDALNKAESQTVIVLGASDSDEDKVYLMAAITPDLNLKGLKAGDLVGSLGRIVGGGGGGQPNLATAGGRFPDKLESALNAAAQWLKDQ